LLFFGPYLAKAISDFSQFVDKNTKMKEIQMHTKSLKIMQKTRFVNMQYEQYGKLAN